MKRYICLIISLCLVLGSFSFVFASATSWDTSDQANLQNVASRLYYNGYSAAYYLKQISDRVAAISTISSDLSTIKGYLFDDGHSIAYWTSSISSWMSPIYNSITSVPVDLSTIIGSLGYYDSNNTYHPYLNEINSEFANLSTEFNFLATSVGNRRVTPGSWARLDRYRNAHFNLVDDNAEYTIPQISGLVNTSRTVKWSNGTPIGNIALMLKQQMDNDYNSFSYFAQYGLGGYNNNQNAINWGNLGTSSFTPSSSINGIYSWLSAIQAPVARLSYVLASDQRIAAQEAAALAEQEVVDDFIDPAGDSSATASDFGSISDLSSGYQQNFGSTASISGIFDIFDSNNFGWFSSETYQQLDTTVAQRGSSFETPLLDQQLEDISRALGVDYAN